MATVKEARKKLDSLLKKQSGAVARALQAAADLTSQLDAARAELAEAEAAGAAPAPAPAKKAARARVPVGGEDDSEDEEMQ